MHSYNFVDPNTGVHTQTVEAAWNSLKLAAKMKKGIRACDLEAFLDERMWQQWRGAANVTENIFPVISSQFTYQPV